MILRSAWSLLETPKRPNKLLMSTSRSDSLATRITGEADGPAIADSNGNAEQTYRWKGIFVQAAFLQVLLL